MNIKKSDKKAQKKYGEIELTPEERLSALGAGSDSGALQNVVDKLDSLAFYVDMIKNGMTVNTGQTEALTRLFTGQKMYVDTRDTSFSPHIMFEGIWEKEITGVWRTQIRPDDVVLDVGANFGYYGLIAAPDLDLKTKAAVHFIEPNPHLTPLIDKSAKVSGLFNHYHVEQAAISDKPGSITFNLLKDQWCSSSINDSKRLAEYTGIEYEVEETIKAKVKTIDQYAKEQNIKEVGLMKLDVEGFEDKAFAGMEQVLKNSPNLRLFLEFTIDAYEDAKGFFKELQDAFSSVQVIEHGTGNLIGVANFAELEAASYDRWAMLLLTKGS